MNDFYTTHKEAIGVVVAWVIHVWWPEIKHVYPNIKASGGVFIIVKEFFYNPSVKQMKENTNEEKHTAG
jgi:hypothetical protein